MRLAKQVISITLFIVAGFAVTTHLPKTVAQPAIVADADKVVVITYPLSDLPVWSQDGKTFAPAILIAYLKAAIDPTTWDGPSEITAYPKSSSLIIATTMGNHEAVASLLRQLRNSVVKSAVK